MSLALNSNERYVKGTSALLEFVEKFFVKSAFGRYMSELAAVINEKLSDFAEGVINLFRRRKPRLKLKKTRKRDVIHNEEMNFSEHTRKKFAAKEKVTSIDEIAVGGEKISVKSVQIDSDDVQKPPLVDWSDVTTVDEKKFLDGLKLGIGLAFLSMALNGLTDDLLFNIPSSMLMWQLGALGAAIHLQGGSTFEKDDFAGDD